MLQIVLFFLSFILKMTVQHYSNIIKCILSTHCGKMKNKMCLPDQNLTDIVRMVEKKKVLVNRSFKKAMNNLHIKVCLFSLCLGK